MNITPHDRNTFLVESRSVEGDSHIVDTEEMTCSCPGFQFNKTCQHLKALMPNETQEMELVTEIPGEPSMKQLAPFGEFKAQIESLKKTAETITVTDISQTAEMKIARTTRLALKDIRIAITHRHKELKENILVEGRKIDAGKNELLAVLEPLELRLKDQEEFIERETARIQGEKRIARTAELTPFLSGPCTVDLGLVKDDAYAGMLDDAKNAHAAKLAREQKEREEAAERARIEILNRARANELAPLVKFITVKLTDLGAMHEDQYAAILSNARAVEKAEAEAAEAQRLENARLKKEAEEREAQARKEREEAAKEKARLDKQLADERKAAEEKAAAIKKEAEEKARAAAEAARKEREAIEDKARQEAIAAQKARESEQAAFEAEAKKQREAAAKEKARLTAIAEAEKKKAEDALIEAREQRIKIERAEAARKAAEEAEKQHIADEAAKAAKAPDKEKLTAFAEVIWKLKLPELTTDEGKLVLATLETSIKKLGTWIEKKASEL